MKLKESIWRHENFTVDQLAAYFDELDDQIMRRKRADFQNKIMSIARDTFLHVQGVLQVQVPKKYEIDLSRAEKVRRVINAD